MSFAWYPCTNELGCEGVSLSMNNRDVSLLDFIISTHEVGWEDIVD